MVQKYIYILFNRILSQTHSGYQRDCASTLSRISTSLLTQTLLFLGTPVAFRFQRLGTRIQVSISGVALPLTLHLNHREISQDGWR